MQKRVSSCGDGSQCRTPGRRARVSRSASRQDGGDLYFEDWPFTALQDFQVMRRITSVIARPMIGSPTGAPSATTIAEAMTARLTYASPRAWAPSAVSAGL